MHADPEETAQFLIAIIKDSPSTKANDILIFPSYLLSVEPFIYISGMLSYSFLMSLSHINIK